MNVNRRIIYTMVFMSVLFLSLIGYLTYFTLLPSAIIAHHGLDKRQWIYETSTLRGIIYDRNDTVLAYTDPEDMQLRIYPYGSLYSHVIGYSSMVYGKSQLESVYNDYLVGRDDFTIALGISGAAEYGFDLTLTIDHELQQVAEQNMKGNGAVVAINPKTGEVLALVSKPDFNPNEAELEAIWGEITESQDAPLFPRATRGLYAPGSTFKIITSAAAIEQGLDDRTFEDDGTVTIGGKIFKNYSNKKMGSLDLSRAFQLSSNIAFCILGSEMGGEVLSSVAGKFGFEKQTEFDLETSTSRFPIKSMSETDSAAAAIGQWEVLATPLEMALVTATIANNGIMQNPYILERATNYNGAIIDEHDMQTGTRVISTATARKIQAMMVETVKEGTGRSSALNDVQIAGKTGTAENEMTGKEHAWFVAYAPAENPTIAVAVIVEYSGTSGSESAAPIAREVIRNWVTR